MLSAREFTQPLVSIVLPVLNGEKYLKPCLNSVMRQTYPRFELIIINDGSTDGTDRIITEYLRSHPDRNILYLVQENRGPCKTINRALREAHGDYFCYIGADDLYLDSFLSDAVEALSLAGPEVCSVYLDGFIIDGEGRKLCKWSDWAPVPWGRNQYKELLAGNWLPVAGLLHRSSTFREMGPLDEDSPNEDYHMWLRLARRYRFQSVPKLGFMYRMHGKNKSGNDGHVARTYLSLNRRNEHMRDYLNFVWALLQRDFITTLRLLSFLNLDLLRRTLLRRVRILWKKPPVTVRAGRKLRILRLIAANYHGKLWRDSSLDQTG